MKTLTGFAGGLAGAIALNILHETYKRLDHDAPRVDLVGEEALTRIIKRTHNEPPAGDALYAAALGADLASNALYYSLIGAGSEKNLILRGAIFGLAAGAGAVTLTKPLGLNDAPVTRTNKTRLLTIAWYLAGGLVTGLNIKAIRKYQRDTI